MSRTSGPVALRLQSEGPSRRLHYIRAFCLAQTHARTQAYARARKMHTHARAERIRAHAHVRACMHMHARMHAHVHALHTNTQEHVHARTHAHARTCMRMHARTHAHSVTQANTARMSHSRLIRAAHTHVHAARTRTHLRMHARGTHARTHGVDPGGDLPGEAALSRHFRCRRPGPLVPGTIGAI